MKTYLCAVATTTTTTMPASSSSGTTIPSKSSLRDYRKPTKPKLSASAAVSASSKFRERASTDYLVLVTFLWGTRRLSSTLDFSIMIAFVSFNHTNLDG